MLKSFNVVTYIVFAVEYIELNFINELSWGEHGPKGGKAQLGCPGKICLSHALRLFTQTFVIS